MNDNQYDHAIHTAALSTNPIAHGEELHTGEDTPVGATAEPNLHPPEAPTFWLSDLPDYQRQVLDSQHLLQGQLDVLRAFSRSKTFFESSDYDKALVLNQIEAMQALDRALEKRAVRYLTAHLRLES